MVNSASMSSERAIPDLWDVFGSRGGGLAIRRNSWQKMQKQLTEEEQAVTDLFNDLHVHADLPAENNSPAKHKQNARWVFIAKLYFYFNIILVWFLLITRLRLYPDVMQSTQQDGRQQWAQ